MDRHHLNQHRYSNLSSGHPGWASHLAYEMFGHPGWATHLANEMFGPLAYEVSGKHRAYSEPEQPILILPGQKLLLPALLWKECL
ncbi:hypothetical protein B0H12DRAFT_1127212 [Mycena haematopus]|nr:hypothetical protein B0H12DRAFT_1127212 [Mycena haematopus]